MTDDGILRDQGFVEAAEAVLAVGGGLVALHLRGPTVSARMLVDLSRRLIPAAEKVGASLLINDRVDVAMACGAHGIQLGRRGMSVAEARRLLGPDRLIGASIHSVSEAAAATHGGADFLLAGTLFPTPSHPECEGAGTDWLRELSSLGPPVIGIGGITPERTPGVRSAGALGVAVMRGVWGRRRPADALAAYVAAMTEGVDRG